MAKLRRRCGCFVLCYVMMLVAGRARRVAFALLCGDAWVWRIPCSGHFCEQEAGQKLCVSANAHRALSCAAHWRRFMRLWVFVSQAVGLQQVQQLRLVCGIDGVGGRV